MVRLSATAIPAEAADGDAFLARLREFVGIEATPTRYAQDAVNQPMIRHFVEALGDENPIYVDERAAIATGRDGIVAPPPMLSTWLMVGYKAHKTAASGKAPDSPMARLLGLLADAGFVGVVATDDEHEYVRELRLGDELKMTTVIEDVSARKITGLGPGHFVTTLRTYTDQHDEVVARQRFRILRFDPSKAKRAAEPVSADPGLRHKPFILRDNEFWFSAAAQRRLVIQACSDCGMLRHPPGPICPRCHSYAWHEQEATGRGTVHSYVVSHHPKAPGYDYPLTVLLVDLEEGTRLIADFAGRTEEVEIGMPVQVEWLDYDGELTLPRFRAVTGAPSLEKEDH
ncbi:bifunctional MaoC family dehydratase N-terminal/OB-fold nucleic acid binding domain-containing protein [Amycolatopsis rhizosphaerae]|uniref:bifunctional MaoC family dehydratase N-terminal/OB-fold nucleic acid binding domain-containing protein n=1 Tax=Amycolatopsis rhizosphaerae TaxID=2053003 RepID=UPI001FE4517C|nr:MaoC family dehydratase N-terminal domain-containing protein [Amycolatopsis rhizosphaerae]